MREDEAIVLLGNAKCAAQILTILHCKGMKYLSPLELLLASTLNNLEKTLIDTKNEITEWIFSEDDEGLSELIDSLFTPKCTVCTVQ